MFWWVADATFRAAALSASDAEDNGDLPTTVIVDITSGAPLGLKLMTDNRTGRGALVKACRDDGLAHGRLLPGQKITHINGADVSAASLQTIFGIMKVPFCNALLRHLFHCISN